MLLDKLLLVFGLVATLWFFWLAGSALRQGVIERGTLRYARDREPAEFWFAILSITLFPAALTAVMFYQAVGGHQQRFPVIPLFGMITSGFWLIRGLQTDITGLANIELEKRTEPGLYWLFLAFIAAAFALSLLSVVA
jgi:hypothetical protein